MQQPPTITNSRLLTPDSNKATTLRILAIADLVEPQLYNNSIANWIGPVDLIISCGDLPPYFLDFLVTTLGAPMIHVLGNHCHAPHDSSGHCLPSAYSGVYNLHGHITKLTTQEDQDGPVLLVGGLEGSPRYNNGPHQFSEQEAALHLSRLVPGMILNKARTGRYLDILVTHSPPRGIHDNTDIAHKGFTSLLPFLDHFKPALLLHGHTHRYDPTLPVWTRYKDTEVINAYGHVIIELTKEADKPRWQVKAKGDMDGITES